MFPKKTAQGSEITPGITTVQLASIMILSNLITLDFSDEDYAEAQRRDPALDGVKGDEYFARRAYQLAIALHHEWAHHEKKG